VSESKTTCVIWDMDGVIADTGIYHFKAWQKVFGEKGVTFTRQDFNKKFGQRNDTIIRSALGEEISQSKLDAVAKEKEETFRNLAKNNVKPLPGAVELLKSLGEHGFKLALASSAPMENIRLVTESLGIYNSFQAMVYGREVTEGKPSPQPFLLAAKKLGIEPRCCVVIEDAIAGVAAAKRAGMRCIAVTNTHSQEKLAEADLIVDSLEKVTVNDVEKLIDS
jgi:beta-phosphoglucomutase family hydrolase